MSPFEKFMFISTFCCNSRQEAALVNLPQTALISHSYVLSINKLIFINKFNKINKFNLYYKLYQKNGQAFVLKLVLKLMVLRLHP